MKKIFLYWHPILFFILYSLLSLTLGCSSTSDLIPDPNPVLLADKALAPTLQNINPSSDCLENRMALDIGSGSTKVLIAEVDFCLQRLHKIYFKDSKPIKIKEQLKLNNQTIPESIQVELINVIRDWKLAHKNLKIKTYLAVATEVFRQAKNGTTTLAQITKATKIKVKLIQQTDEAKIGFYSALALSPYDSSQIAAWDIGGGSQQLTLLNSENNFITYQGKMASVSFKDLVLNLKFKEEVASKNSPNPLGPLLADMALKKIEKYSRNDVPAALQKQLKTKIILGIGGVHNQSLAKQLVQNKTNVSESELPKQLPAKQTVVASEPEPNEVLVSYTPQDLLRLLQKQAELADPQLNSEYPETEVTNIILVLGYMNALAIPKVSLVPADLTYGLILFDFAQL